MVKLEKLPTVTWHPTENIEFLSSNIEIDLTKFLYYYDDEIHQNMDQYFSDGTIWGTDGGDFNPNRRLWENSNYGVVDLDKWTISDSALEEILYSFDNWAGTKLDILGPYGDIDYNNNIFAENFELNVPVKIYSEDDDLVFKVDAPWMKVESFDDVDLYPSKLNLKSVLAMLPVTVNSKELKASFINGEFRLEVPKNEISVEEKIKNS